MRILLPWHAADEAEAAQRFPCNRAQNQQIRLIMSSFPFSTFLLRSTQINMFTYLASLISYIAREKKFLSDSPSVMLIFVETTTLWRLGANDLGYMVKYLSLSTF